MTLPMPNPPTRFWWRAGRDGLAHAQWQTSRYQERTACKAPPTLERWAWPARRKCGTCLALLDLGWMEDES